LVPHGEVALLDAAGRLIAIAQGDSSQGTIQPRKVLM
jgi:hypothetical protein